MKKLPIDDLLTLVFELEMKFELCLDVMDAKSTNDLYQH